MKNFNRLVLSAKAVAVFKNVINDKCIVSFLKLLERRFKNSSSEFIKQDIERFLKDLEERIRKRKSETNRRDEEAG